MREGGGRVYGCVQSKALGWLGGQGGVGWIWLARKVVSSTHTFLAQGPHHTTPQHRHTDSQRVIEETNKRIQNTEYLPTQTVGTQYCIT